MGNPSEPVAKPEWAVEYARAALALGHDVSEVETGLLNRGLSQAAAAVVITSVLEERARGQFGPPAAEDRADLLHRALSAVVVCGCLLLAYQFGAGFSAWKTAIWVLGPLACIWFPSLWSSRTPETFIRWGGWVLLLLIGAYRIVLLSVAG